MMMPQPTIKGNKGLHSASNKKFTYLAEYKELSRLTQACSLSNPGSLVIQRLSGFVFTRSPS